MEQENKRLRLENKNLMLRFKKIVELIQPEEEEEVPDDIDPGNNINLENLDSTAIFSISVSNDIIGVVFRTNVKKKYEYTVKDINEFISNLNKTDRYGVFINKCIGDGVIVIK